MSRKLIKKSHLIHSGHWLVHCIDLSMVIWKAWRVLPMDDLLPLIAWIEVLVMEGPIGEKTKLPFRDFILIPPGIFIKLPC